MQLFEQGNYVLLWLKIWLPPCWYCSGASTTSKIPVGGCTLPIYCIIIWFINHVLYFHQVFVPVSALLVQQGHQDYFVSGQWSSISSDEHSAAKASLLNRTTLDKAGFITHNAKPQWQPVQRLTWLGFRPPSRPSWNTSGKDHSTTRASTAD